MRKIGICGAGSIGCFVGGRLAAANEDVLFYGRPAMGDELKNHGLTLRDYKGVQISLAPHRISFATLPDALSECSIVLVTVKSLSTLEVASQLRACLKPGALVVSMQNGVNNGQILREKLPEARVLRAMVPFNVVHAGPGRFYQGTRGALVLEARDAWEQPLYEALQHAGLDAEASVEIERVQWSKLLLNLNNPINALADLPLLDELKQHRYRSLLADCISEGLRCMRKAGIRPKRIAGVPVGLLPMILRTPNFIFELIARRMLAIGPEARSSMWEDLQKGRLTEINALNGEILRLGAHVGVAVPKNQEIYDKIKEVERSGFKKGRLGL